MHSRAKLFIILICILTANMLFAQKRAVRELREVNAAPEEIISFSQSTSFSNALFIINDLSRKFLGKMIINREIYSGPIGVDINNKHFLTGLELILQNQGLWYEEYADYIRIHQPVETEEIPDVTRDPAYDDFSTREVVISAVFFEADAAKLRQAGMSWSFFYGKDVNLGIKNTSANEAGGLLEIDVSPVLDFADITAVFKALESDQVGEVITSPKITVKSGEEGKIQVGADVAITLQDFAGNTVTQLFSTGSIINVKPTVVRYDSIDFINLDLKIERSNSANGETGLEIRKSFAETSILLLDGEETIIGGLNINEESNSRSGVPFLKDLPWWFFGMRYIFGHESVSVVKKEVLILIRGKILPPLRERFRAKLRGLDRNQLLKRTRQSDFLRMEDYKRQVKTPKNNQ